MAHGWRDLVSFTIEGTDTVVIAGDCVLIRSSNPVWPPNVGRVQSMESYRQNEVTVRLRWFYRPEQTPKGRRVFHGLKELFFTDHYDIVSARDVMAKCAVHTLRNYMRLEDLAEDDYFCRFAYMVETDDLSPDRVPVYCVCEMPRNPDQFMVQCRGCRDWIHPSCIGLTNQQAMELEYFLCLDCSPNYNPEGSPESCVTTWCAEG